MKNEPAITVASITAGVTAFLGLLAAFGLPLTDEQTSAILGVVAVVGPLVVGFIARRYVVPSNHVAAREEADSGRIVAGPAASQTVGTAVVVTRPTPPTTGNDPTGPNV